MQSVLHFLKLVKDFVLDQDPKALAFGFAVGIVAGVVLSWVF